MMVQVFKIFPILLIEAQLLFPWFSGKMENPADEEIQKMLRTVNLEHILDRNRNFLSRILQAI